MSGTRSRNLNLTVDFWMLNPVVETTRFRASCTSRVRLEVRITSGVALHKCSNFRNGDLIVGEDFEEVRLKFIVCSVDLIDQEDGGTVVLAIAQVAAAV